MNLSKIDNLFFKNKHSILLFLLIIFHMANISNWYNLKIWPRGKAYHCHLITVCNMLESIRRGDVKVLLSINGENPPVYYWMAIVLKNIFNSYGAMFWTSSIFLIILLLNVYFIGKKLKNNDTGILAAIICSFFPLISLSSSEFNLELATAAVVSLILNVLISKDIFKNLFHAFYFGVVLGIGFMTRSFVGLFIVGPFIVMLMRVIKNVDFDLNRLGICLFIICIVAGGIASLFFNDLKIVQILYAKITSIGHAPANPGGMAFYILGVPKQIGMIALLSFLVALWTLPRNWRCNLMLLWIFCPLLSISLVIKKEYEYSMAYLPSFALIIGWGINSIKNSFTKKAVALFLIIIMMDMYFLTF